MNTKEILISKTKEWLSSNGYSYVNEKGFEPRCRDKTKEILRDGKTEKEVYVVSFKFEDVIEYNSKGEIENFIEGKYGWAYYDPENLSLIYIAKIPGYIEPDGSY